MRNEFSKKTKLAAWERCRGLCEVCQMKLIGRADYDHKNPDATGGSNELENCQVLCSKCHRLKTSTEDVPAISRADRLREKAAGLRKPKHKWPKRRFGQ